MLQKILDRYGLTKDIKGIEPFGSGLINHTWMVSSGSNKFILQRINENIFKSPRDIGENIRVIGEYFAAHEPGYLFVTAEKTLDGQHTVHFAGDGYFRLFPFVKGSCTIDVVNSTVQAYEAARQFGRFTKLLSAFPAQDLNITLPDFHNLPLRYSQFKKAIADGNKERVLEAESSISYLESLQSIVTVSEKICHHPFFKKRVTHHDTKISNVLFDEDNNGLCVIDLDTVMPGYFISDVGDMLRTYLSPVNEEEKDFIRIGVRSSYFKAIAEGYLSEMNDELSDLEKEHFVYAGKFMIYMQALRFITDHLNNDVYYGAKYVGHNLLRAQNQINLLEKLIEKEPELAQIITSLKHHDHSDKKRHHKNVMPLEMKTAMRKPS